MITAPQSPGIVSVLASAPLTEIAHTPSSIYGNRPEAPVTDPANIMDGSLDTFTSFDNASWQQITFGFDTPVHISDIQITAESSQPQNWKIIGEGFDITIPAFGVAKSTYNLTGLDITTRHLSVFDPTGSRQKIYEIRVSEWV